MVWKLNLLISSIKQYAQQRGGNIIVFLDKKSQCSRTPSVFWKRRLLQHVISLYPTSELLASLIPLIHANRLEMPLVCTVVCTVHLLYKMIQNYLKLFIMSAYGWCSRVSSHSCFEMLLVWVTSNTQSYQSLWWYNFCTKRVWLKI